MTLELRAAIAVHHTDTSTDSFDGPGIEASIPNDAGEATLRAMFAWVDPEGDPEKKASYRFIHHLWADGKPGPADMAACESGIGVLNGGRGGTTIPDEDREGVWRHLAAHLRDGNAGDDSYEPPTLKRSQPIGGREERTFVLSSLEVRAAADGKPAKVVGHAAVYNQWSEDLGGFKERVRPGAFTKTLQGGDVRALFNHDPNFILGRTKSQTLALADEKKGLHFEITPPDTQTIRDLVLAPIERGDVDQCSFSFSPVDDEWREPKQMSGLYERDLKEVRLFDVSPVTFPAYTQTDVGMRSLAFELGTDVRELSGFLIRIRRGLSLSPRDRELLAFIRSNVPSEADGGEPSGPNPGEGSQRAVATRAALLRDLEHRIRTTA